MTQKKEKKQKEKKKFLERTWLSSLLVVVIVFVVASIIIIPKCTDISKTMSKYVTLSQELAKEVDVSHLIDQQDILTNENKQGFETKVKNFVENTGHKQIFDLNGNFVKDNLKPQEVVFKQNSLMFDKNDLGCFLNACLGAGWQEDVFDEETKTTFLNIVGIKTFLVSASGKINLCVVAKLNLLSMLDDESKTDIEKDIKDLPSDVYFVLNTTFDDDHIYEASLQVNELSKQSNQLFLELLFNNLYHEKSDVFANTKKIVERVLQDLLLLDSTYSLNHSFVGKYLIFEK